MAAATQEERDQWMTAIEDSIEENPFCRLELGNKISIYQYELSIFAFYNLYMNIFKKPFCRIIEEKKASRRHMELLNKS